VVCFEPMTICRLAPLPIEDAGDDAIGVIAGQAANERDRVCRVAINDRTLK
jgi:hypothetical protein